MSPDELMNPELQKLAEAVRKESISQSTLQKVEVPRIRRTHKGEEFVGDVDPLHPDSSVQATTDEDLESKRPFSSGPTAVNYEPRRSASPFSSGGGAYSPDYRSEYSSLSPQKEEYDAEPGLQNSGSPSATPDEESGDLPPLAPRSPSPTRSQLQIEDDEIDRLINSDSEDEEKDKNEKVNSSDSQSPTLSAAQSIIWKGKMNMVSVGNFSAHAVQVGGPAFDGYSKCWSDVVPTSVDIDGRLARDRASSYLFNVASTRDLVAVKFTAQDAVGQAGFDKLFDYFESRDRYGVMRNKSAAVKDAYLAPMTPSGPVPDFVSRISGFDFAAVVTQSCLIGVYVVNRGSTHQSNQPVVGLQHPQYNNDELSRGLRAESYELEYDPTRVSPPVVPQQSPPPLSQQHSAVSIALGSTIKALGLPQDANELLTKIILSSPEVLANPALASDPLYLITVVKRYQQNGNGV